VADALARGDLAAIGPLVDRSQELAERFLGNQIPETIALAREARRLGAVAASAFGAGFGGSVWALVATAEAETFRARWSEAYSRSFPAASAAADFFATRAGPGLVRLP
jgi:galactokinase